MTTVLHIDSSSNLTTSKSRALSRKLVNAQAPAQIIRRDLATDPLPFVDEAWINARLISSDELTPADKDILALSDDLVAELQAADIIVIGVPLYNFGAPAVLKAWIDLVARPKVTFRYTPTGPIGLLTDKKAIIAPASGGVPIGAAADHMTPHLKMFLAFLGITDVTIAQTDAT